MFAKDQFRKNYGYPYDPQSSTPGDMVHGKRAQGVSPQFYFDEKDDMTVAVRTKVRISIVRYLTVFSCCTGASLTRLIQSVGPFVSIDGFKVIDCYR